VAYRYSRRQFLEQAALASGALALAGPKRTGGKGLRTPPASKKFGH